MESPKWKRISDAKARVLIVGQVKPAILQRNAVRFDLTKDKGIERISIFRTNFNDHFAAPNGHVIHTDFGSCCFFERLMNRVEKNVLTPKQPHVSVMNRLVVYCDVEQDFPSMAAATLHSGADGQTIVAHPDHHGAAYPHACG